MASGQSESSVELARLGDESRGVIRTPAASGTETSSGSTVASARPYLPFYSLSWLWPRSLGILQSIKLPFSASKWRAIHSTINTAAMVLAMLSFPLVVFGAWMAWAALKASWWAQSKEEFEWCEDHNFDYPGCEALSGKTLSIPTDPSPFKRSGNLEGHAGIGRPLVYPLCWARSNIHLITLFAISLFMWTIRRRIARVAFGFLRTQQKAKPQNHQQLEEGLRLSGADTQEGLMLSGTETAFITTQRPTLLSYTEATSRGYPGHNTGAYSENQSRYFTGSSSAYRNPYDAGVVYRPSSTNHYKKTATARLAAISHSKNVRGYDTNDTSPRYTSSLYRSYNY